MQKILKENKGITLVALVLTIIILLILAGVALSLVIGENGLIAKSKQSVEKYKDKAKEEQWQLEDFEVGMEKISLDELQDEEEHPELKSMKLVLNITEDNKTIQLPVYTYEEENDYIYDCEIDWGDNTTQRLTNNELDNANHIYNNVGIYTITINGRYECLYAVGENASIKESLIKVEQWGTTKLKRINLYGCNNLIQIATPSRNSFTDVVNFSFRNCKKITSIPEKLFANCPKVENFESLFSGCSSLTDVPERLFANCSNVTSFERTFSHCDNLTTVPEKLFVNCYNVTNMNETFYYCININNIPDGLFDSFLKIMEFNETFGHCYNLTTIPEKLFANCSNVTSFNYTFDHCGNLMNIPEKLFANCPNVIVFNATFNECSNLRTIPKKLFENCLNVQYFGATFRKCSMLMGNSIQLWNEEKRNEKGITENSGGPGCYAYCKNLSDYANIPEYWAKDDRVD